MRENANLKYLLACEVSQFVVAQFTAQLVVRNSLRPLKAIEVSQEPNSMKRFQPHDLIPTQRQTVTFWQQEMGFAGEQIVP